MNASRDIVVFLLELIEPLLTREGKMMLKL